MNTSSLYQQYVAHTFIYRVVPASQLASIKKKGIIFGKDPYKKLHADAEKLFKLALKLHRKGFIIERDWGKTVDQKYMIKVTRKDIRKKFIDFTPSMQKVRFYKTLKGGALITTLYGFAQEILARKAPITKEEKLFVQRLLKQLTPMRKGRMTALKVKATEKLFETAQLQGFDHIHLPSPFGSVAHFEKVIKKHGWKAYERYLTGKTHFYIRVRENVPAKAIH